MLTVNDVESLPYRVIEILLLLPTALWGVVGIGAIFIGLTSGAGVAESNVGIAGILATFGVAYLGFVAVAGISWLATPVVLYLDLQKINDADVDWNPNPVLWAVLGLFLGYLMKLSHLYYRHQYIVDWVDRDWWWLFVMIGSVLPTLCFGLALGLSTTLGFTPLAVLVGLGILTAVPFPLAIYKDATYVRLNSPDWRPNPGNYVNLGVFFLLLAPIVFPVTGGYYLFRRYRAIGM